MNEIKLSSIEQQKRFVRGMNLVGVNAERNIFSEEEDPKIIVKAYSYTSSVRDFNKRTASDRYEGLYYTIKFKINSSMIREESINWKNQIEYLIESSSKIQDKFELEIEQYIFSSNNIEEIKEKFKSLCNTDEERNQIKIFLSDPY